MKDLRIVFMGTPDFAVGVLKKLISENKNIVGVITAPDKPSGRGRKLQSSALKEYAISENLKILQPTNLKDHEFLLELKLLNANLQIVVAFRMLPKVVWQMPEYGTFNLHASLLPQYRGAAPINWAIINGEAKTGVTTFFIDEKIDTGEIILQKETPISPDETAGTLHDTLMMLGSDLVVETVNAIENRKVQTQPQPKTGYLIDAPKLTTENTKIDWSQPGKEIDLFIRGLSPYPASWTTIHNGEENMTVKIYNCSFEKTDPFESKGKVLINKNEMKIVVNDGYLYIKEIQLPSKRKMDVASLLNGFTFAENSKVL